MNNQAADTSVVWETRSPTWNQTLMFHDLIIYGEMDFVVNNPPTIMAEIFDYDEGVNNLLKIYNFQIFFK